MPVNIQSKPFDQPANTACTILSSRLSQHTRRISASHKKTEYIRTQTNNSVCIRTCVFVCVCESMYECARARVLYPVQKPLLALFVDHERKHYTFHVTSPLHKHTPAKASLTQFASHPGSFQIECRALGILSEGPSVL